MRPTCQTLITCEHGGNRVPAAYRAYFAGHESLLGTHRGYDPGALTLARQLARALQAPLHHATVSRLVIDLNRSIGHPRLYSEATRAAPAAVRKAILQRHYLPYRQAVEAEIERALARGRRVIHIASHSFTPVLDGETRHTDVGLLYDPGRPGEKRLCALWRAALNAAAPELRVRMNHPYTGKSDGLTAWLRRRYADADYAGIELEINQKYVMKGGKAWQRLRRQVVDGLLAALRAT